MKFHPKKSLGQNFLHNPAVISKIIMEANLTGNELVVEVGPGFGILTEALLKKAGRVIAIEKDERLYNVLVSRFCQAEPVEAHGILRQAQDDNKSNLNLIHADALKIPPPTRAEGAYLLIANIPYSITSPLLDHFIRENPENLPQCAVLLVQKEVAEKICARPPRMNVLALHVQAFGNPKIVSTVSRHNFQPVPKVDSAIIKIEFPAKPKISCSHKKFFELIHAGFSHKRKMLRAVLPITLLKKTDIDGTRRAETLSLAEWESLAKMLL